ncbi:hypothetical protein [Streptomyces sp. NPDC001480]|uniref:hypothetical protein n=1 Tax=Streptomyces sp. NPDC001480 TaxID=3364577 RepID=UPI0036A42BF4
MTIPAELREHCHQARDNARTDGLVPALTLLMRALSPKAPPRGPRGHAVLPRELLEEFAAMEADGDGAAEEAPARAGRGDGAAGAGLPGLAVLAPDARAAAYEQPPAPAGPSPAAPVWNTALAWLRLGMSEQLREVCLAHLAGRQVDGSPLLMQQMVKGALADVLIEHLEIEGVLDELMAGALDEVAVARLQEQITRADRALLRLLGAHGFTLEGPGAAAYASEVLADVYGGEGV